MVRVQRAGQRNPTQKTKEEINSQLLALGHTEMIRQMSCSPANSLPIKQMDERPIPPSFSFPKQNPLWLINSTLILLAFQANPVSDRSEAKDFIHLEHKKD